MGYSRFWLKVADEESKSIPHEFPRSHWSKATGQCAIERYLSATMGLFAINLSGYLIYTGRHAFGVILHHFLFNFVIAFL